MKSMTFTGRLGRDAEVRNTKGGEKVCNFAVAVDDGYGDRKTTLWIDCSLWGDRGPRLVEFLKKGTEVTIIGDPSLKEFDKRDGSKGVALAVRVGDVALHGGVKSDAAEPRHERRDTTESSSRQSSGGGREPSPDWESTAPF